MASRLQELTIEDMLWMNRLVEYMQKTEKQALFLPRLNDDEDLQVTGVLDASLADPGSRAVPDSGGGALGYPVNPARFQG